MGDGPEKQNLMKLTSELNLEKRISFPGYVTDDEKYKHLSVADIFILTSVHEGFGIVFMEAMFCGLPIVCTNYGGQVDFLKNKENAILIDVSDVESCKDAIIGFYRDRELYRRCSENNLNRIKDFYADNVAKRYTEIFKKFLIKE